MSTDRELLELAAKAASIEGWVDPIETIFILAKDNQAGEAIWNPLTDDGDALQLAVKLRINILFSGGRHHVGPDRFVLDVCREGGIDSIRWEIVHAAAEIGRAMS
ncbi:hypothetical protein ABIF97_008217 [Bradyrhizobium japonicum]